MNFLRKLALAGIGLGFVLSFAVTDSYGQYRSRSWGSSRTYSRGYIQYQSPYRRYNSYNRYRYNRYNGISWRERRRLRWQRYRMIRAQRRYYRTRARILNRRGYYNRPQVYYRNW